MAQPNKYSILMKCRICGIKVARIYAKEWLENKEGELDAFEYCSEKCINKGEE